MNRVKYIALVSLLICLLVVIPTSFAMDNQTVGGMDEDNQNDILESVDIDVIGNNYYFDASANNDTGNGSINNPYKEFNSNRIQSNSIIYLKEGNYNFKGNANIDNVTIIGDSALTTFVNNVKFNVINSFVIYNLTLVKSSISNSDKFVAINSIFKDSSSTNYGGVINSNAYVNLDNCTFINNSAVCGGAIYIKDGILEISNTSFIDNYAELFGGAITAVRSNSTLFNVTGKNNKAKYDGGVVYSMYGNFSLSNSSFENNVAQTGGALFIDSMDSVAIQNNQFINNTALSKANAIYSFYNFNSSISNNENLADNDLIETNEINMFIGDGNYTLYWYDDKEITEIPSKYNLADLGYVTSVKNQNPDGTCWAFATIATLESNILKAVGEYLDLSEFNVKNLFGCYSDYGWTYETNSGGTASMGYNYLISWLGPVLEEHDPYITKSLFSPLMNSVMHVQNVMFIQRTSFTDNDEIKRILMTYGAIYSQINALKTTYQYYNGGINANHAITIVGWDDDLEFEGAPGKGGWIYKNSWGLSSGDHGYYYVSYYDTSCLPIGKIDSAFTFILNDTIKYDKNYQYDIQGKTDFFINSSNTVWYKNKFTATDEEYLTAVSTIFEKNTKYEFSIYVNGEYKITQKGFSKPGYYTFNLNEFIPLKIGDVFEIVFKITVDGEAGVPISENVSFMKCYYNENTSFLSYDGENWTDLFNLSWKYSTHTYASQVACIKAFTVLNEINTTIILSDNPEDGFNITATVLNQYGRHVNNGILTFTINGTDYPVNIVNGVARIHLKLIPDEYDVSARFEAVGYNSSSANGRFISYGYTKIELTYDNEYNPVIVHVNVTDHYGDVVSNGNVTFVLDGEEFVVGLVEGYGTLTHIFKSLGSNEISASYKGDCYFSSDLKSNVTVISTIVSANEVKTLNSQYQFKLLDNYGNPLKNANVTVSLNSKDYNLTTGDDGIAKLIIDLTPGTYVVEIVNPLNGELKSQNILVVKRITENKAVTMYYGAGSSYNVRVFDDNGNIAKNVKVKFTVNGKTYYRYTDSEGYASLKISLKPNKYTITAEYKGFKVSNKLTVKSTIITKDKTVKKGKTIKFTVKLLNSNGKILKNKKITIKFKGKTYKVKTNKKGIATLKITKKYKAGKYTISTKYGSLTIKNKITIKK